MTTMWDYMGPLLWPAFWMTIKLTFFSGVIALVWGMILAGMAVGPVPIMRSFANFYVNVVRNTPLTLIILFCWMGLFMMLGLTLAPQNDSFVRENNFRLAILGLSFYTAAFVCETLRAGINTVPVGQAEAARALGLPFFTVFGTIVLPQALRAVTAPLGSVLIALTKNSTIASVIGVSEAALLMKSSVETYPDSIYTIFAIIAAGFVAITLPMGLLFTYLANRLAVKR
ncbi:amino acid ABC transporter permease [Nocardiopsis tropica]